VRIVGPCVRRQLAGASDWLLVFGGRLLGSSREAAASKIDASSAQTPENIEKATGDIKRLQRGERVEPIEEHCVSIDFWQFAFLPLRKFVHSIEVFSSARMSFFGSKSKPSSDRLFGMLVTTQPLTKLS
jgi:hypothetical protein